MNTTSWYHSDGQQTFGPLSEDQIIARIQAGQFNGDHLLMQEGSEDWQPLSASPFAGYLAQSAPAQPEPDQPDGVAPARRVGAAPVPAGAANPKSVTHAFAKAHRGLNRNLLVLGTITLLMLGGLGAFIASRMGGNISTKIDNVTHQITNNSYFTQLVAAGVTTAHDLEGIDRIRPYRLGFIGVSREKLTWEQALELARRTGAEVVQIPEETDSERQEFIDWMARQFPELQDTVLRVRNEKQPMSLKGSQLVAINESGKTEHCLLGWKLESRWRQPLVDIDFAKSTLPVFVRADDGRFHTQIRDGHCELRLLQGGLWWPAQPALHSLELDDFECEVEVRFPQYARGSWGIGLIRHKPPTHPWIGITLDPKGQLEIRPHPEKPSVPLMPTHAFQAGEDWNRLRVTAVGPKITVHINDQFVVETLQERRLSPNALTLFLTAGRDPVEVWFRRVRVRRL